MAAHTTRRRRRTALVTTTVLLVCSACTPQIGVAPRVLDPDPTVAPCQGIVVAVDGRALSGTGNGGYAEPTATCVETDRTMTAQTALASADVTASRTSEGIPAAVCRVDGEPFDGLAIAKPGGGIYVETCTATPPDHARWVVWTKPSGAKAWTDESEDITTLELAPGDAVALVFTYRGKPSTPSF